MTVGEWLAHAAMLVREDGSTEARAEAMLLLRHATGLSKPALLAHPGRKAPGSLDGLLTRRLLGEPIAYIVGVREFYGREFKVSPDVLIPRHETETLVEQVLFHGLAPGSRVLDVGTGSGCLAVTLALERPDLSVFASDISPQAIAIARENAEKLGALVEFRCGDLLAPWGGECFHLMVSNPPYVASGDPLPRQVADFEPHTALYAGEDGLDVYRRLALEAPALIAPGGALVVEAGDGVSKAVEAVFVAAHWRAECWRNDLGTMPRAGSFRPPCALPEGAT